MRTDPKNTIGARTVSQVEADLRIARDEENRQYWLFTRTARGRPVDPAITRRIAALETELSLARRMDEDDHGK